MTNKRHFFVILVLITGVAMVLADFLLLVFFEHSFSHLIVRLGIPGIIFVAVYCGVLGLSGKCFAPAFFSNINADEFALRLKQIGAVPIKMIALNVVLHAIFLGAVFFRSEFLGVDPVLQGPLFLAALSFGMLVGTFIYVVCDGLVSKTLIAHNLTQYPRELRERRQELKAMIVPLAVGLISLILACSITILCIRMAGGTLDNMHGKAWSPLFIPVITFFVLISLLAFQLKKNSSVLYTSIIEQLENLSSERKDLSRRISVCSVDELGTITGMVNTFSEYLSGGMRDIKGGQKDLSQMGDHLESNASNMADSVALVSDTVENILAKTHGQLDNANTSSQAVRQISDHIKALQESIAVQSSSMAQASVAVEAMVGNIASIGSVTEKMAAHFETVGEAAEEGSRIQKSSAERVNEIVAESQSLQEANRIIASIAAKTNLLAMNAAIEAAHAGVAGRGFSVVADEIRTLAENSSSESQKIRAELKQIVQTIALIVKDAQASGHAFAEVSRRVGDTARLVNEVDHAVREQKTGASKVMESLRVMNDLTGKVSDGSREMSQGSEAMLQEIGALQSSAGEIKTSMEEMFGGIKNIASGAQDVSKLAGDARASIQKISVIADGFEV